MDPGSIGDGSRTRICLHRRGTHTSLVFSLGTSSFTKKAEGETEIDRERETSRPTPTTRGNFSIRASNTENIFFWRGG